LYFIEEGIGIEQENSLVAVQKDREGKKKRGCCAGAAVPAQHPRFFFLED